MPIAYVTEYAELASCDTGVVQAGLEPNLAVQKIDFGAGVAATPAVFNDKTRFVRVWSDTAGYIKFGSSPTAVTATDTPISATTAEFFGVRPGQSMSIIQ